ncbi:MAG: polyprenyl synthetase family protein [Spirochaetota bacterium]
MMSVTSRDIEREMLDIVERELAAYELDDHSRHLADTLRRYVTRPGGRMRPRVLTAAARAYRYSNSQVLRRVSAATELLHVFALMHDDRLDGVSRIAEPGNAEPSHQAEMSRQYELLGGDILHAIAHSVLVDTVRTFGITSEILTTVRHISVTTIGGQAMDMEFLLHDAPEPTVERLKTLYDRKTGYYSFVAPLTIAALLGEASPADLSHLRGAGLAIGRAYQFCDDLDDIRPFIAAPGGEADSDPDAGIDRSSPAYWEFNMAGAYLLEHVGIDTRSRWHTVESRDHLLSHLSFEALADFVREHIVGELKSAREFIAGLDAGVVRGAYLQEMIDEVEKTTGFAGSGGNE